jgi:hypothetical protein
MRKLTCMLSLIVLFSLIQISDISAEEPKLKWSGFFDIQHNIYKDSSKNDGFRWGQFELGLSTALSDKVSIEGAIAHDYSNNKFGLVCGLLKIQTLDNCEIAFGQFDVPLGIDYNFYPSINRPLVSSPLLSEKMHTGWNDLGARISINHSNLNGVFYLVNGQTPTATKAQSIGGRLGFTAQDYETGLSFANDTSQSDMFWGVDFTYNGNNLNIISEYMLVNNASANKASSYYIQTKYDLGKYFILGRYGQYKEVNNYDRDGDNYDALARISLGAGYKVDSNTELRFEYQLNSEDGNFSKKSNDAIFLQSVVGF